MPFNTHIDDKDMVSLLLTYGWTVWKDTWTNCPYEIYKHIENVHLHDYKHQQKSWFADNHLSFA